MKIDMTPILSHISTILIFVPIVLPLLVITAVLGAVFFCAVVYERLYVGIKYAMLDRADLCEFCKTNKISVDNDE